MKVIRKSPHEGVRAAFQHVFGGTVNTQALIKKYKEELQQLRREFLRAAADEQEKARIEHMILVRKRLLSELGAEHG